MNQWAKFILGTQPDQVSSSESIDTLIITSPPSNHTKFSGGTMMLHGCPLALSVAFGWASSHLFGTTVSTQELKLCATRSLERLITRHVTLWTCQWPRKTNGSSRLLGPTLRPSLLQWVTLHSLHKFSASCDYVLLFQKQIQNLRLFSLNFKNTT